uniref:Uncharacterized protein n=1 Tax=Opuntia streptacantha TaxID=393608 RepID=A0A7C9E5B9_OPUST
MSCQFCSFYVNRRIISNHVKGFERTDATKVLAPKNMVMKLPKSSFSIPECQWIWLPNSRILQRMGMNAVEDRLQCDPKGTHSEPFSGESTLIFKIIVGKI